MTPGIYLQAAPWAVPIFVVGAVAVVLLGGRVARRLGWGRVEVSLLGLAVVGFLSVTVTPGRAPRPRGSGRELSLDAGLVPLDSLGRLSNEAGLNVWLAVPMALVAGYVAVRHRRAWPVALVWALPPLAEGVQVALPPLGRAAFLLADVVANWQGVAGGLVVGAAAGVLATAARRAPAR